MSAVRTSSIRVAGRWMQVPNWMIVERKPWSTEKKNRVRDRAERIGELEKFVIASPLFPWLVVAGFAALVWVTGWAAESLAGMLPKPW